MITISFDALKDSKVRTAVILCCFLILATTYIIRMSSIEEREYITKICNDQIRQCNIYLASCLACNHSDPNSPLSVLGRNINETD